MKKIFTIIALLLFSFNAYGLCVKSRHVIGTGGSTELCKSQYEFKLKQQNDTFEQKKEDYEKKRTESKQENTGAQSGNVGTILNLGNLTGGGNGAGQGGAALAEKRLTQHNVALEWSGYHFPKMYQLDRQMPDPVFMPTGLRYEWYMSKRFGFGAIYQQFTLASTKSFKPITVNRTIEETVDVVNADGTAGTATREVNRDIPYLFPGAINRVVYQRLWYFATFNTGLGDDSVWNAVIRFGSALICNSTIYFDEVDLSSDANKYATQPATKEVSAQQPFFFDFAVSRWFDATRGSFFIRFSEAQNDTDEYIEFVGIGGVEVGVSATFAIPALGYL